jgi:hypothetical protein
MYGFNLTGTKREKTPKLVSESLFVMPTFLQQRMRIKTAFLRY